jgi:hypothetical protein
MGLHDQYYGKEAEPANNNHEGPWCGPEHARMSAGLAELRERLGMPEEMKAESYEVVATSGERSLIPMRKYTNDIGKDDE